MNPNIKQKEARDDIWIWKAKIRHLRFRKTQFTFAWFARIPWFCIHAIVVGMNLHLLIERIYRKELCASQCGSVAQPILTGIFYIKIYSIYAETNRQIYKKSMM